MCSNSDAEDNESVLSPQQSDEEEQNNKPSQVVKWVLAPVRFDSSFSENENPTRSMRLFHFMVKYPWPFLFFLPVVFAFLIGFGWSKDDIVEVELSNIWIGTSGPYARDTEYAKERDRDKLPVSTFAAMAVARDRGNLFTASRLEEIRARMEKTEKIQIEHNGVNYTWTDVCASTMGFPYEFPCARLSPMDLYQEANWFMDYTGPGATPDDPHVPAPKQDLYRRTWYHEIIRKQLMTPLLPRFNILMAKCLFPCGTMVQYRVDSPSSLALFSDLVNLGMNDECRICIETNFDSTIQNLTSVIAPSFNALANELQKFMNSDANDAMGRAAAAVIISKAKQLATSVDSNDVVEFYFYYSLRNVYPQVGGSILIEDYARLQEAIMKCQQGEQLAGITCPTPNLTSTQAQLMLRNWADNVFSSVSTAGSPLPLWSKGDGTGELFKGNSPVGGSGINMSGTIDSLSEYLDLANYGQDNWQPLFGSGLYADPTSPLWAEQVEANPIYAWFMAGLTDADAGTSCGNEMLPGVSTGVSEVDESATQLVLTATEYWCTKYNIPNTNNTGDDGPYSKQHFAKMWYDLLIDSLLGIKEGVHDPYTFTTGQGCGYVTAGERDPYTNMTENSILYNASRDLYFIDEGEVAGVVSPALLMGDVNPSIGEYSFSNPLTKVGVMQTIYAAALPKVIVERVKHCKRPGGSVNITVDEAAAILFQWKEAMEATWSEGWDNDNEGEVQFVAVFDDLGGVSGTAGRLLEEITMDSTTLTVVAIFLIFFFSILFLAGPNWLESRVLITFIGTALVVLAFFGAMGFSLLLGLKISVITAWTLPFVMIGLGVDDMYILLYAMKKQRGYTQQDFLKAMKEVIVPVTMTSVVNLSMFAVLNMSDIPAVYVTSQVASYSVIALYSVIMFCYPAWCYFDMRRQNAGNKDIFFWLKSTLQPTDSPRQDFRKIWLYHKFYEPLLLGSPNMRCFSHTFVFLSALAIFATGCYGITQRTVGIGQEEIFPVETQSWLWAKTRTETLASWGIQMNWGAINYTDPSTQMKMIKQFEDVVNTSFVVDVDTNQLWISELLVWSSRHCTKNYGREDFNTRMCGHDVMAPDNTPCTASWVRNEFGLREQMFRDYTDTECKSHKGGICRPLSRMHPDDIKELSETTILYDDDVFCPVIANWSVEKWQYCLMKWRNFTKSSSGLLIFNEDHGSSTECDAQYNNDQNVSWPIEYSAGPMMFAIDLVSHEATLEMMSQTRAVCDKNETLHCWMSGTPFDYWTQYENIFAVLIELTTVSTLVGFLIALIFLLGKFLSEKRHSTRKILCGSLFGASMIALTMILSLVGVVGLNILAGASLTGVSNMTYVLSVGFTVEYSVHIVVRFLRADMSHDNALDRVRHTMSFLMLPTLMSFLSSVIGAICIGFTEFDFIRVYGFRPLMIVMFVTYFHGCWWLPVCLSYFNWDVLKLGKKVPATSEHGLTTKNSDDSGEAQSDTE